MSRGWICLGHTKKLYYTVEYKSGRVEELTLQFELDKFRKQGIIEVMLTRTLSTSLKRAVLTFPALILTGPRQSGKTTLLKSLFGTTHSYVSLEDPDQQEYARTDPRGFIDHLKLPVILDEIQYVPELLSYIKTSIDENRQPGRWLITGSQNFSLMQGVSESLAGRVAIFSLLPLSVSEIANQGLTNLAPDKWISTFNRFDQKILSLVLSDLLLRGGYPEPASKPEVDRNFWCGSYIATYLERDVRNLKQVGDLNQFQTFLRICATRTGQILDLTGLARDVGISHTTAKRWLSLLEASHQVYLLYPYYKNIGKRLVKRPKLYFVDTGLATYLMGIHNPEVLLASPYLGSLFETFVIVDTLKRFYNHGLSPSLYYLRTPDKLEVDLVIELEGKLHLVEIKSVQTIFSKYSSSLLRLKKELDEEVKTLALVSNTSHSSPQPHAVINRSWKDTLLL